MELIYKRSIIIDDNHITKLFRKIFITHNYMLKLKKMYYFSKWIETIRKLKYFFKTKVSKTPLIIQNLTPKLNPQSKEDNYFINEIKL